MTTLGASGGVNPVIELTDCEQNVLRLIAQTRTKAEIARNLGIIAARLMPELLTMLHAA